jgi:hypothetical protein
VSRPTVVSQLADRIVAALPDEARNADREVLRCALLTAAYRLREAW